MYSTLAWAFITVTLGGAGYLFTRPTVARGSALAEQVEALDPGAGDVTCERSVPVHPDGVAFSCRRGHDLLACTLDRDAKLQCSAEQRDVDPAW